jgi:branched-chain amino acid transport system ATP-binding protein
MLEVNGLSVSYGAAPALREVSVRVGAGEIVTVVGPNGAGKTTLINAIARLLPLQGGDLRLNGKELAEIEAHEAAAHGIALVPEGRRLWGDMTVEENLDMGCYAATARARRRETLEQVLGFFPVLAERLKVRAGTLSGGQQQMVAIGRALMARPKLLLMDEPSLGLSPLIVEQMFDMVRAIHATGLSILLVEQNAAKALEIAQRAYVLEDGRIVNEGPAAALLADPRLREAYLGLSPASHTKPESKVFPMSIDGAALDVIFRKARSHNVWLDKPVSDEQLQALYELMKWGPTSANSTPARIVFVRSREGKERLRPALWPLNVEKTMSAPVTAIVAHDSEFYEFTPQLMPHNPAVQKAFLGPAKAAFAADTAYRNGTLQGAYLIIAARALGLDTGAMSGFDMAKVDAEFFPEGRVKSNFLINIGYGDHSKLHPRNPRLMFDEVCQIV